jgi:hypothetical protein
VVAWSWRARARAALWRRYVRLFDLEHTFRFLKQSLGWTSLRVRHLEQADRWSWLVLVVYAQLHLARACVADLRLPWERHYAPGHLRPCRVLVGEFWHFCLRWAHLRNRQNPTGAPRGGPKAAVRVEPSAIRRSKRAAEVDRRAFHNVLRWSQSSSQNSSWLKHKLSVC